MNKRLIIILALAFVVGIAFAAYAEVQNVKVSGDINIQGVSRKDLTLRRVGQTTFNQYDRNISGILSHVRVKVDADLTDNVSTTVRLINERIWGNEYQSDEGATVIGKGHSTDVQVDLAYAIMKEFLYSPLTLTIGRQELHFGNDLIIGDVDTNNFMSGHGAVATASGQYLPRSLDDLTLRKSFDAVRATLNYDPLVVDAAWSKIDDVRVDRKDDVDLYGVNANYAVDKNSTVEGYYWEKKRQKAGVAGNAPQGQAAHHDIVRTVGARAEYRGIKNLLVGLEGAFQFGRKVNNTTLYPNDVTTADGGYRRRRAYALQFVSQYDISELVKQGNPLLGFTYTLLSGEPLGGRSQTYRGWDPMFENQAGGTLFNKILGYSNAHLINGKVSLKPMEDVTFAVDYYHLRLARAFNTDVSLLAVNLTGVVGDPTYVMVGKENTLGNEVDATLTYDYTEDVQFGLGAGWFRPGKAFNKLNKETATQVVGSMKVTF